MKLQAGFEAAYPTILDNGFGGPRSDIAPHVVRETTPETTLGGSGPM